MSHGRTFAFSTFAVVTALALHGNAQSVISARSGVVHFFEGEVYLADQKLEPHFGRYPTMSNGEELRTAKGRAEVLLTPGVFLRLGEDTAIRLVAGDLADTRIALLSGSAIVESTESNSDTSVTLSFRNWNVRFLQKGGYRIDSEPPRLCVQQGEAEVSAGDRGSAVRVRQGMELPFAEVLVPESQTLSVDAFADWSQGRNESIQADNAITAQIDEDAAARNATLGLDSFAYFPMLGVPAYGSSLYGAYSAYGPPGLYQPGFNSIYLPGYAYRPLLLGVPLGGYRTGIHSSPIYSSPIYSSPIYSSPLHSAPRQIGVSPSSHPIVIAPHVPPAAHPGTTAPGHPAIHVGGHR